jgi:hypothetical protein
MRVPVLAYHSNNIEGNGYRGNDHVAFAADLRTIRRLGLRIVPLQHVVDRLLGRHAHDLSGCVALSCDDGTDFDYFDLDHPVAGRQRSLFNALLDFRAEHGREAQPDLHLTCFVIASPAARAHLDRTRLFGANWISQRWWRPALRSGLVAIGNHSWDHNHDAIPLPGLAGMVRGSFLAVDDAERADAQIAAATRHLETAIAPFRAHLFCYPYAEVNDYLRTEYLPRHVDRHGMDAAFGAGAEPVTEASDRWNLPRYVCGWHWKDPGELAAILRDAA